MIRLILVRHGNTFEKGQIPVQIGSRSDLPLTDFGKKQAERMGRYLYNAGICPDAIFSGKLKRHIESATMIGDYFDLPIFERAALNEIDYGEWEGLTAEAIQKRWPKEYREWIEARIWPSFIFGQSFEIHKKMIDEFLGFLQESYQKKLVLAVTSNGLLQFFKRDKVKTGNFCELHIFKNRLEIESWNREV